MNVGKAVPRDFSYRYYSWRSWWCFCGGTNSPTFILSIVCLMVVNKPDHCEVITFSTVALFTESQEKHTFEKEYNPFI